MNPLFEGTQGSRLRVAIFATVVILAVFLGIRSVAAMMELRYVGAGVMPANTITISGEGEMFAVPDIAEFTFSVTSLKPTVAAAQEDATTKMNAVSAYLKDAGIAEKDIRTTGYNIYPQYDYETVTCAVGTYCPGGRQVLRGYEVRQTTTVKVRDTAKAGDLLAGVGTKGATEVSSLTFTFDDPNMVQDEARNKAIADAKEKADVLAKQLGVHLVRVVSFNESTGGYPVPMYARDVAYGMGGAENAVTQSKAPDISTGENKITSYVTVTYEIR